MLTICKFNSQLVTLIINLITYLDSQIILTLFLTLAFGFYWLLCITI